MSRTIVTHWTPSQQAFDRFAALSGDDNPIHVDPAFSARTRFGRTVSHGMLLYARIHALIGNAFPGCEHDLQTLMFPHPAYAGETLDIRVENDGAGSLTIEMSREGDGAVVLQGTCRLQGAG